LLIAIIAIIAMSEKSTDSDDSVDGLEELFDAARISEKGLAKLSAHEVTDKRTLLLLTSEEIGGLKLAIADKARLNNLLISLRPNPVEEPTSKAPTKESPTSDVSTAGNVSTENQVPVINAGQQSPQVPKSNGSTIWNC
jgi:hypothetical protein